MVLFEFVDQLQSQTLALADADQFAARLAQGLAVLAHEQIGARIDIVLERIEALGDDRATLAIAERRPAGLRGLGGRHRPVDILGRAAHDRADNFIGPRRIAYLDPVGAVDPLAIDQQAGMHGHLRIGENIHRRHDLSSASRPGRLPSLSICRDFHAKAAPWPAQNAAGQG